MGYIEARPAEHIIVANQAIVPVDFREKEDGLWRQLYDDLDGICGKSSARTEGLPIQLKAPLLNPYTATNAWWS